MIYPVLPYQKIPGFFDYQSIYDMAVRSAKDGSHFVELGSFAGRSSAYMAKMIKESGKRITFDCIDHWWHGEPNPDRLPVFLRNMRKAGVMDLINPIQMYSEQAMELYWKESLDFIFIDADHTYESVSKDLRGWHPKIKIGGIIAGHDYNWDSVKKAVDEFFDGKVLTRRGNISESWIAIKV